MISSRPVWVEINLKNLRYNIRLIKQFLAKNGNNSKLLAVVKTNAYGHGLLPVSRVCVQEKADYLGVTSVEEGIDLRRAGIETPILILGTLFPFDSFREVIEYDLTPTIASLAGISRLNEYANKAGKIRTYHLKVDTGMGRIGISHASLPRFLEESSSFAHTKLEGIFTHFSSSDSDRDYTLFQFKRFKEALKCAGVRNGALFHCSNSAAMLKYPQMSLAMVRPGLLLYGLSPFKGSEKTLPVKSVLSWKASVVFTKKVPRSSFISYGKTFRTKRPSVIATVPVGYGDGYRRSLSNKGVAAFSGRRAHVAGRVTMDMTMFDVTALKKCAVGDTVDLVGGTGGITLEEMASIAGTNSYETACGIHPRVNRIYLDD